MIPNQKDLQP